MINKLLEVAKANDISLEVTKLREKNVVIETHDDTLKTYDSSDITSYSIKAIYNNKTINIETENIDNIDKIIEIIKKQSLIIDNIDADNLAQNEEKISGSAKDIKLDFKQIKNDMLQVNEFKKKYENLKTIDSTFEYVETDIGIYNTLGTKLEDKNNYICFVSEVTMLFNGIYKTSYKYFYDQKYDKDKFYDMVEEVIKETNDKQICESVKTNRYNILLDNLCVAKILEHFVNIYSAEDINKNKSILTNKLNQKVFSDKITIVEDPLNEDFIGKRLFDDEGTKTSYKEIIKNGVFKTKLYDNKTALKDNTVSTGNSYGVRNLYIVPGVNSKEELFQKLNNGIFINDLQGLHAGIDDATGNMSLQAEGYLVENGKKVKTLNMIILTANIFELFNNIEEIGNDLKFKNKKSGAPSLLINDITIAGNK